MDKLERITSFDPASDNRDKKGCGTTPMAMWMVVKGLKGAVQFVVFTGWHLPHVRAELPTGSAAFRVMPGDLGYHSHTPLYEGQIASDKTCVYLGGPCYYDGSTLAARDLFDKFTEHGHEAVWTELERLYRFQFENGGHRDA